ncbi:MAG: hypothetical protein PHZ23_03935 [Acidiphilium sp.]|nr:hypothetical protein [Acidiphilium sp.]
MLDNRSSDEIAETVSDKFQSNRRYTKRLSDKILISFHHACDKDDLEIAEHLLVIFERITKRIPVCGDFDQRKNIESLVAAHERLWNLRHPPL